MTRAALWLLLVVSIATNLFLVLRAPPAAPPLAPQESGLRSELDRCRSERLSGLERALRRTVLVAPSSPGADLSLPAPPPAPARVTPELQHDALCVIALDHLHRQWEQSHDALFEVVRRDLLDPAKRAETLRRDLDQWAAAMQLTPTQRDQLTTRYQPLRDARLDAAAAAASVSPPDFGAILEAMRGLFSDEDAVVRSMFGGEAVEHLRAAELEKRTAVLAIVSALGNQAWGANLHW